MSKTLGAALIVAALGAGTSAIAANNNKTCICHIPPGNPENAHTICVGAPAVRAHLRHGDTMGECPVACGGARGDTCEADEFCKLDAGVCDPEAEGVCTPIPPSCPGTLEPVCGCDGTTYDNACLADAAGVAVNHAGPCETSCGGEGGAACAPGQFCKRDDGACSADATGVCTPLPSSCPPDLDPVCGCDGTTYSNACFADVAGVPVSTTGACVEGVACGGAAGDTCTDTEFCRRDEGVCSEDAEGNCAAIPGVCSPLVSRVCGCNGTTYDNACLAAVAGVSVDHQGACAADVVVCGGSGGATCGDGEFCQRAEGACGTDAEGTCEPAPATCPPFIDTVCGCDGTTYSNACVADAAGVAVASSGSCVPERACGGDSPCREGEFCEQAAGACADPPSGTCTALPTTCPVASEPVCGCDNVTYDNACLAAAAGVSVRSTGACPP